LINDNEPTRAELVDLLKQAADSLDYASRTIYFWGKKDAVIYDDNRTLYKSAQEFRKRATAIREAIEI